MDAKTITVIKDILLAIAAITTATVAITGLRNWSKELKGKAYFDLARRLMMATYKVRDQLQYGRNPFTSAGEFPEDYDPRKRAEDNKQEAEAWAYVFNNRWKPIVDAVQELEVNALEAEALWGREIKNKLFGLRSCTLKLRSSMNSYVSRIASHGGDLTKSSIAINEDVFVKYNGDDELSINISKAVENIEKEVLPHIRKNKEEKKYKSENKKTNEKIS